MVNKVTILTKNFDLKLKMTNDQTVGTATLCPLCKHNGKDCNRNDMACDAVIALDTSIEENNL